MKYIMVPALCLLSGVAVANECQYSTGVSASFNGVISKSKNYDKTTYAHVDDTRKCVVKLDVQIKDKWYPTSGSYIFGPNMAENTACKNAETSAKENILRSTVPEILKKNTEQNCNITVGEKPKEVEPPKPPAVPTIPVQIAPLINQNGSTQQNSGGFLNRVFQVDRPRQQVCRRMYMNVWIDGVMRAAWKEICK